MARKKKVKKNNFGLLVFCLATSWFLVAFGKPLYLPKLSVFSVSFGFMLLWYGLSFFKNKKLYFLSSFLWFASISAVEISWMASTKWVGPLILIVYALIFVVLGLEFALVCGFFYDRKTLNVSRILAAAGLWTLLEWSRQFVLSGFTFSVVGASLTYGKAVQLSSLIGIYGLSFWVILIGGCGFLALLKQKTGYFMLWLVLFLFPYGFGYLHELYYQNQFTKQTEIVNSKQISVLLMQTALSPVQKEPLTDFYLDFIRPEDQWERIFSLLKKKMASHKNEKIDLLVLPEVALPFSAFDAFYPLDTVLKIWQKYFHLEDKDFFLPLLKKPLAKKSVEVFYNEDGEKIIRRNWKVTNAFWTQALANYLDSDILIGLDDHNDRKQNFNAAFYFRSNSRLIQRYEKQILVPIVEYFPFKWCARLAAKYGISGVFTPGKRARVFQSKVPFGVSICYEETYGNLMRKNRQKGAEFLVNISNDVWFPSSTLPKAHFELGRLRAVENGIPLVRCCNTGITAAVDAFGNTIGQLTDEKGFSENLFDALWVLLPLQHYPTFYAFWGDSLIIVISLLSLGFCLFVHRERIRKKALLKKYGLS